MGTDFRAVGLTLSRSTADFCQGYSTQSVLGVVMLLIHVASSKGRGECRYRTSMCISLCPNTARESQDELCCYEQMLQS